jgi:hypothetical protein
MMVEPRSARPFDITYVLDVFPYTPAHTRAGLSRRVSAKFTRKIRSFEEFRQ